MAVDANAAKRALSDADITTDKADEEVGEVDADADLKSVDADIESKESDGESDGSDGESDGSDGEQLDEADYDDYVAEAKSKPPLRLAARVGALILIVLAGLVAYLGIRDHQTRQVTDQRNLLLQVARQAAVNLTTIDWQHAEVDIQRILGAATGQFYDDFAKRSRPFIDVVQQVQSKSVGTVTEAGLESFSGNEAQALVAVSVTTTNAGTPEQGPRHWRMRMTVQKTGDDAKVSNVEFVP